MTWQELQARFWRWAATIACRQCSRFTDHSRKNRNSRRKRRVVEQRGTIRQLESVQNRAHAVLKQYSRQQTEQHFLRKAQRACKRKETFYSEAECLKSIANYNAPDGVTLYAYRCEICFNWHKTSVPPEEFQKFKEKRTLCLSV